ncbi:MAG: HAD-IA family hydrolase [Gemmatimonadetes bacterium]|nr:HAD-IA family hydrolase [Gemmatimonadota bacterium]
MTASTLPPIAPDALHVDAILFDLLTALLDSWTLWNHAAGSAAEGRRWRQRYLEITYAAGHYSPYDALVHESARSAGLPASVADTLLDTWDTLAPWPEVPAVLASLRGRVPLGVVTNCSNALAARAVARLGIPVDVVVAAERAGAYKPDPRPYRLALAELALPPERVLFVAGSPYDIPGAGGVGMPVVWHNRLQLVRPDGVGPARAEIATLEALPALVGTIVG